MVSNSAGATRGSLCWRLFATYFRLGAITIGGGVAMLPIIEREMVSTNRWLTADDFLDAAAIAQTLPGVLAINLGLVTGFRLAGLAGGLVAALGAVLPSFIMILIIASYLPMFRHYQVVADFFTGAQPAVVAILVAAAYKIGHKAVKTQPQIIIGVLGFIAVWYFRLHPALALLAAGVVGGLWFRKPLPARRAKEG